MRPIKLKMSAFGPFVKPIELDFSDGLQGENIFLIHGVTGAGKTSILDAICYALYDESSGKDRKIEDMRSEQAAQNEMTEVEFTFALGEKIYKIRRNPRHTFPKGTADIKKAAELYENDKLKFADTKEINHFVKENLLGFNAEQFRQVVMLPQGKFRDFLVADSSKRSEILNVIFNATLYENIEQGLKERAKIFETKFNNLEAERNNILSETAELLRVEKVEEKNLPEHLSEGEKIFQKSKSTVEELKNQSEKAQENLTAGKVLAKDFERFEILEKNLQDAQTELKRISTETSAAKVEYDKRDAEKIQRQKLADKIAELEKHQSALNELQKSELDLNAAKKIEENAQKDIENLNRSIKKCQEELEKINQQLENLQGADVRLAKAEQDLKNAQQRQEKIAEIDKCKKVLAITQKNFEIAEKKRNDAQTELNRLNLLQRLSAAVKLAENLQEGEPCPVCGSINHPHLAISEETIPKENEIIDAENFLKKCEVEREKFLTKYTATKTNLQAVEKTLQEIGKTLELPDAEKFFQDAKQAANDLKINKKRLENGTKITNEKIEKREQLLKNFQAASKITATLRGTVDAQKNSLPQEYRTETQKITKDLSESKNLLDELNQAWQKAVENFNRLEKKLTAQETLFKKIEADKIDAAKKISDKKKPDITELNNLVKIAAKNQENAMTESARLEADFVRLKNISKKLRELAKKILSAENDKTIWKRLADVADGKNNFKISFQRYYLNAMLQDIVIASNERLEKMSGGRYRFKEMETFKKGKRSAGLDLEIFDAYFGKARPVETLSGGESFLASLSLALGLATVVKNTSGGINLDTIFIDEGFGTLDSETLDIAINTLEDLQSGGRLVGIISHVDELKQRIPARLEVTKTKFGSSAKFIKK